MSVFADKMVAEFGPVLLVRVLGDDDARYLVPRYYLARHRTAGDQFNELGFPRLGTPGCLVFSELPAITCARCGRTSCHPGDVANLYCRACHVFHAD